jgi:hypothetical protein
MVMPAPMSMNFMDVVPACPRWQHSSRTAMDSHRASDDWLRLRWTGSRCATSVRHDPLIVSSVWRSVRTRLRGGVDGKPPSRDARRDCPDEREREGNVRETSQDPPEAGQQTGDLLQCVSSSQIAVAAIPPSEIACPGLVPGCSAAAVDRIAAYDRRAHGMPLNVPLKTVQGWLRPAGSEPIVVWRELLTPLVLRPRRDQQTMSFGPGCHHPPGSAMAKIEWPDAP